MIKTFKAINYQRFVEDDINVLENAIKQML